MNQDFRCSKSFTPQCQGCEGDYKSRQCCDGWNTSEEIANAIRILISHVKNTNLRDVMK